MLLPRLSDTLVKAVFYSFHRDAVPLPQEGGSLINRFFFAHPKEEANCAPSEAVCYSFHRL